MANGNGNGYGPSFRLARLYRKQSKNGGMYFTGRLGFARVTLLKSREVSDDGGEIWNLLVSEGPQPKQEERPTSGSPEMQANVISRQSSYGNASRMSDVGIDDHRRGVTEGEIPF